jgi:hypothetical protein
MRKVKVDLADLVDAFGTGSAQVEFFLDLETGQVIPIPDDVRFELAQLEWASAVASKADCSLAERIRQRRLPDWLQQAVLKAVQIEELFGERYVRIPQAEAHDDYRAMEEFIEPYQTLSCGRGCGERWMGGGPSGAFGRSWPTIRASRRAGTPFRQTGTGSACWSGWRTKASRWTTHPPPSHEPGDGADGLSPRSGRHTAGRALVQATYNAATWQMYHGATTGQQAVALEDGAHGRRGDAMAEFGQLVLNAAIAPARVLPRQAQDERLDLGHDGRAAPHLSPPHRPLAADQLTMPLQHGLGLEQEQDLVQAGARAGDEVRELGRQHGQSELLPA